MLGSLKGMFLTLTSAFRRPVTDQYPNKPRQLEDRFMGFPALTWDHNVGEPFCTSCMVCIRQCPTQCMSATMIDNPLQKEGKSHRRKIVDTFEINLNRCILCGICVDVCAFDAIEMSHEHELASYERAGARADLGLLLDLGRKYQAEEGWQPENAEKNVARVALAKKAAADAAKAAAAQAAGTKPAAEVESAGGDAETPDEEGDT